MSDVRTAPRDRLKRTLRIGEAFRINSLVGGVLAPALRVGVSYTIPIMILVALGHIDLTPYAALGAFTSLYCRSDTYRHRAQMVAITALGLTTSVAIGAGTSALTDSGLAKVVVLAAVATAAKLFADVVALGAPGGLMFVFAAGAAAYSPQTWSSFAIAVAVTGGSAAFSYALGQAAALVHPTGPKRLATARALVAVTDYLQATDSTPVNRHRAFAAVHRAEHALYGRTSATTERLRGHLAHAAHLLHTPADGTGLRAAADRIRHGRVPEPAYVAHPPTHEAPMSRPGLRARLAPYRANAVRMAIAALATGLLASAIQTEHSYWAVVSASSVLQSTNATSTWHRALQRTAGTIAGSLLALLLFSFDPSALSILVVIVVCQVAAELVVQSNYGLGLTFATPLALCLVALTQGDNRAELIAERIGMTLFGAVVATLIALLVFNGDATHRLRHAIDECRRARRSLLDAAPDEVPAARSRLLRSVFALRDAHAAADGELSTTQPHEQEALDVEHEAYRLLTETAPQHV